MAGKALQLAYCNADGVCGRKLKLHQFLSEHSIDICILKELHPESDLVLRFANHVCHWTDRLTREEAQQFLFAGV
jgi:hypothetical protein